MPDFITRWPKIYLYAIQTDIIHLTVKDYILNFYDTFCEEYKDISA